MTWFTNLCSCVARFEVEWRPTKARYIGISFGSDLGNKLVPRLQLLIRINALYKLEINDPKRWDAKPTYQSHAYYSQKAGWAVASLKVDKTLATHGVNSHIRWCNIPCWKLQIIIFFGHSYSSHGKVTYCLTSHEILIANHSSLCEKHLDCSKANGSHC